MNNKKGISLISLIITIIVIIILAAIVIFSGLGTPDSANFAKFASEFSDFNLAVDNAYMEKFTDNALTNTTRSKAQIYYELASGVDVGMNGTPVAAGKVADLGTIYPEGLEGEEYYLITDDKNVDGWNKQKQYFEEGEKHYITDAGEAFFLPGYLVQKDDGSQRWYINESKYYIGNPKKEAGTGSGGETPGEGENPEEKEGKSISELIASSGIAIGDYVTYSPMTASNTYDTTTDGTSSLYTGYSQQTLTRTEGTVWRVIKVDSSNNEVIITPTDAVNTDTKLYLGGAPGYINHKTILDDVCNKLYSNTTLGLTARSMTQEDLDYTVYSTTRYAYYPNGTTITSDMNVTYNGVTYTAKAHTSPTGSPYKDYRFWEYDYAEEERTETIDGKTYTYGYPTATSPVLVSGKILTSGTNTSAAHALIGSSYGWLASSHVHPTTFDSRFCVRFVYASGFTYDQLAYSNGDVHSYSCGVRPVVSLGSTLQLKESSTVISTNTDNSPVWDIVE